MSAQHVEVPIPAPKEKQVLIKVEATSLNPIDWKTQKGILWPILPGKFPHIPSTDVAGKIVEVGAEVKTLKEGDNVVAKLTNTDGGGLAEFAVAEERLTVVRTPEVSAAEGASLPVAALSAHQALTQLAAINFHGSTGGGGQPKNILVTAASGGVGHYAVQLAKLGNAHVTATCGARNIDLVRSLGADEVLDYRTPEGAALKSPSGRKYDVVLNCAIGISWSTFDANLTKEGMVIDFTPTPFSMMVSAMRKLVSKKQLIPLILKPKRQHLDYLVNLVKNGKLKTVIDSKYSLSKAEFAWEKSIDGHATGKIIVEP
ncbi:hypothetical protein L6164_003124 [Bauhinia variegata]|uniref:Uncharacterized protein n=1 Tax=Bauhinia variegata TaxID=167791 RepID=A0ACB9Q0E5_BAUVA|nr:hypothetical protein L6164_003124 [Bauhinia variegata]